MASIKGLGWTFDTVADSYGKFRPGYPDEMYALLFDYIHLDKNSHAIEVGIGSGQATLPVLDTGCKVTAVEYGEKFSAICTEKFKDYPFDVITAKFEDADLPADAFDLVFSATAFHWVPEEIGYKKVHDILRSGGAFARFANRPYRDKGNPALTEEIDRIYDEYYYTWHKKVRSELVEFDDAQAEEISLIAEKYGFVDIKYATFSRIRSFTAQEYVALLGTYSDHIAIEEKVRNEFFAKIAQAIESHGGVINIYDTIDIELARKK